MNVYEDRMDYQPWQNVKIARKKESRRVYLMLKRRRGPRQIRVKNWMAPRFRYRRYFGIRVLRQSNIPRAIKSLTVRRNAIRWAAQRRQNVRTAYIFFPHLTCPPRHFRYLQPRRGKFQNHEKICILIKGDKRSDRYFVLDFFILSIFHSLVYFSRCNHVNETTRLKSSYLKAIIYERLEKCYVMYSLIFVLIVTNNTAALFQTRH